MNINPHPNRLPPENERNHIENVSFCALRKHNVFADPDLLIVVVVLYDDIDMPQ